MANSHFPSAEISCTYLSLDSLTLLHLPQVDFSGDVRTLVFSPSLAIALLFYPLASTSTFPFVGEALMLLYIFNTLLVFGEIGHLFRNKLLRTHYRRSSSRETYSKQSQPSRLYTRHRGTTVLLTHIHTHNHAYTLRWKPAAVSTFLPFSTKLIYFSYTLHIIAIFRSYYSTAFSSARTRCRFALFLFPFALSSVSRRRRGSSKR